MGGPPRPRPGPAPHPRRRAGAAAGPGVVVLSGCETGRTGALSATEQVGLPDAFLAAGARSVLAAGEVIDDARTAAFMAAFYRHGGATRPGPALTAALAERRAAGDDLAGVFTLSGRP
ncbi:MAG: CHAT domain-containing protein [bacterium]